MSPEPVAKLTMISAQVPAELVDALKEIASQHERSLSAEIRIALRAHVEALPLQVAK